MGGERPTLGGAKAPRRNEPDRLHIQSPKSRKRRTDVEGRILGALGHMHLADERSEMAYREDLDALRERPDEVRAGIESLERSSPDDHQLHWSLYHLAAGLEAPELAPMLVESAARDLPEITADTPCESVDEDRVLVAVMAVEGLERLAAKDPETAEKALRDVIERQPNIAVRAAAVQALAGIRPDAVKEIGRVLPEDQAHLVDLRRIGVEQVTAEPERTMPGRSVVRSPKLPADRTAPQERTE
jgi:hypothetical protein